VILAEDEAKIYLQASSMAVWAPRGQTFTVRCDPGRAHANFYGTLNLKTGREIVTQAVQMNAETTALHLHAILDAHPNREILLLWDRAPWHRGPAIRAVRAAYPRLTIIEFPTAAPDLNPQEHVWRATRRKVCHNHTEQRLPGLAERFTRHLTKQPSRVRFLIALAGTSFVQGLLDLSISRRFGKHGQDLARRAHGIDAREVVTSRAAKSISQETTFARDVNDQAALRQTLSGLAVT
jgi:transposase